MLVMRHAFEAVLAVCAAVLLAVAFLESGSDPEPPPQDYAKLTAEAPFYVAFRPADWLNDPLAFGVVKELMGHEFRLMEEGLAVPLADLEQVNFGVMRGGEVTIFRTHRAYDFEKAKRALVQRDVFDEKEKADKELGGGGQPALNEKKVGGRTIYYAEQLSRWTEGICQVDARTFLRGRVGAMEHLLTSKAKPTPEMSKVIGRKHSFVIAVEPTRYFALIKQERKEMQREIEKERKRFPEKKMPEFKDKDGFKEKDGFFEKDKFKVGEPVRADVRRPQAQLPDDEFGDSFFDSFAEMRMLPYKPLLESQFAYLTLDIGKTYTLTAHAIPQKGKLSDAETAAKTLLYVAGELAVLLPKMSREPVFPGMKSFSEPLQKAFQAAKVERKDNAIRATVTLTPDAALTKKVVADLAEARKNRERGFGRKEKKDDFGFKEKRMKDGEGFKDKK